MPGTAARRVGRKNIEKTKQTRPREREREKKMEKECVRKQGSE